MTYRPPQNKRQTSAVMFAALAAAVAFFVTAGLGITPLWLWQMAGVVALALFILVVSRYQLCEHKYILEDGDLIIVKVQGKKETRVCFLSMENARKLLTQEEYLEKRRQCKCFNYVQNISPTKKVYLHFDDGRESVILILEPDERFLSALKEQIK